MRTVRSLYDSALSGMNLSDFREPHKERKNIAGSNRTSLVANSRVTTASDTLESNGRRDVRRAGTVSRATRNRLQSFCRGRH